MWFDVMLGFCLTLLSMVLIYAAVLMVLYLLRSAPNAGMLLGAWLGFLAGCAVIILLNGSTRGGSM